MSTWTSEELIKIGAAEELQIASVRRDGALRSPVTIWVVPHGDDLYVRSVAAYRTKYRSYAAGIIDHITSPEARAATLKLVPR
jgi:hypothetical protein